MRAAAVAATADGPMQHTTWQLGSCDLRAGPRRCSSARPDSKTLDMCTRQQLHHQLLLTSACAQQNAADGRKLAATTRSRTAGGTEVQLHGAGCLEAASQHARRTSSARVSSLVCSREVRCTFNLIAHVIAAESLQDVVRRRESVFWHHQGVKRLNKCASIAAMCNPLWIHTDK